MRTPSPASAMAEEADQLALGFEVVEEQADAFEILERGHVVEKVGAAADDQRLGMARGRRPPRRRGRPRPAALVSRSSSARDFVLAAFHLGPRLGERPAADVGVEVVPGLDQRRGRRAGFEVDQPVLDRAVLADQHDQAAGRLDPDELDMLEANVDLAGEHDAGAARQAGQRLARIGEERFRRVRPGSAALTCASICRRSSTERSPTSSSASTKNRSPNSVGSRPAEVCGA